jgi:RecA-family ATPase
MSGEWERLEDAERRRALEERTAAPNGDARNDQREDRRDGDVTEPPAPYAYVVASSLAGKTPPPRRWLVPDWIPDLTTTEIAGDSGTGKSLLALQLQVAAAASALWLGLPADQRRSYGVYCEDPADEVHRRLEDICASMLVDMGRLDAMAWTSLVDEDAILAVPDNRHPAVMVPTPAYWRLLATIEQHRARLVVLDTRADMFGGDEIRRAQVRSFLQHLNRLARRIDGCVVMTAHPSVEGMRSGAGTSGSTAWPAGVRSRLYLTRPEDDGADPDARALARKKANHASIGDTLNLRWERGALVAIGEPAGVDRSALNAKADRVFRSVLVATYGSGVWASANPAARNYALRMFARRPDREGLELGVLEQAMHRLMHAGSIRTEPYGRRGDERMRLAPA